MGLPGGFARNFNMWGGVGCVNVGVHVYTWYAAGVFMCTHGTLLVCHVQKCYAWGGVGWGVLTFVFICKHGTLLLCHVQTYHAIAVSRLIVHRFLILIGFNVFLLAMCLKNSAVSLALGTRSGVQGLGECMSSSEATATESSHSALYACSISSICWAIVESSAHGRIRFIKVSRAATTCSGARGCFRWNLIHASFSTPKPVCNAAQSHASSRRQTNWTQSNKLSSPCCRENTCQFQSTNMNKPHPRICRYLKRLQKLQVKYLSTVNPDPSKE